jgi:lipoprotein-releasing system ATP-binding protein
MSDGSPMVEARQVRKTYRDGARPTDVLLGVDLEVSEGEAVAIVGPSGSGKSTLLHLLGGLDRPDGGTILVQGRDLSSLGAEALARFRNREIGFVFQYHELLPDFDALENVTIPGRIAGRPLSEVESEARRLLVEVGLEPRLHHFPSQLSGGERQRVALCRALLLAPPLLLADEPTGNLDRESGGQILDLLLDLRERRRSTAIVVTHNPEVADRCGRVLRLEGGVIHDAAGRA